MWGFVYLPEWSVGMHMKSQRFDQSRLGLAGTWLGCWNDTSNKSVVKCTHFSHVIIKQSHSLNYNDN